MNRLLLMLHKTRGVVVTRSDEHARKTVYGLLPPFALAQAWQHAGRLDKESSGLLFFAREGVLLDHLTAPGGLEKEYAMVVRGHVLEEHVKLATGAGGGGGVSTPIGLLRAASIHIHKVAHGKSSLQVKLHEGKNRHIRRMFGGMKDEMHGSPLKVLKLKRVRVGGVVLGELPAGEWRWVEEQELKLLGVDEVGELGEGKFSSVHSATLAQEVLSENRLKS